MIDAFSARLEYSNVMLAEVSKAFQGYRQSLRPHSNVASDVRCVVTSCGESKSADARSERAEQADLLA